MRTHLEVIRSVIGNVTVDQGGENLAVQLCSYYEGLPGAPDQEPDEYGWTPWATDKCDAMLALIAKEVHDYYAPMLHQFEIGDEVRFHPIIGMNHDGKRYKVTSVGETEMWLEHKGKVARAACSPCKDWFEGTPR